MPFLVYKRLIILFSLFVSLAGYSKVYETEDCVKSEFKTKVGHKGWPFGLHDIVLEVEKKQCHITISHEQYKYMKKKWTIDVCRGPVHIKMGTSSIEVFKRLKKCGKSSSNNTYCSKYSSLTKVLQDDGLIFAQGHKEDLESDHGRIDCTFKLVREYLNNGFVFSLHKENNLEGKSAPVAGLQESNHSSSGESIPSTGSPADF